LKKLQKKKSDAGEAGSPKPNAIVLAGLQLFTQFGYRKTSIDDIARAAQVAKRTVYLHFQNKADVFLAILEHLGEQVRRRCAEAETLPGTPLERLTALLDAYFGLAFELFGKSDYLQELEQAFSELAREKVAEFNAEYRERLVRFLRSLQKTGEVGGPPRGLSLDEIAHILIRSAEGAKHEAKLQGDRKALETGLRQIAILTLAAMSN